MLISRFISHVTRSVGSSKQFLQPVVYSSQKNHLLPISRQDHLLLRFKRNECGLASFASPETSEKEQEGIIGNGMSADRKDASSSLQSSESRGDVNQPGSSNDADSDVEGDRSIDDLVKILDEKEELLKSKHKEIEVMQDKVLRAYAEMENVMDRTKREAENSKKFAIQGFTKSLLDVADNLGRASTVVKSSFSKLDTSNDTTGVVPLLQTLLDGVEMTEKQLMEVFKKYGVEKYDPTDEPFDPHRHNAVFQVSDNSKPAGTVAAVLKAGYTLYDRVIRPAEVGVTHSAATDEQSTE